MIFAYFLLGERVRPRYFFFLAAALLGCYLLVFADPARCRRERPAPLLGVGAALLWALGTVLGKFLGGKVAPNQLAGLRFPAGLPIATVLLLARGGNGPLVVAIGATRRG